MTQFIDLSLTIANRPIVQTGDPEITYMSHDESARERGPVLGLELSDFDIRG